MVLMMMDVEVWGRLITGSTDIVYRSLVLATSHAAKDVSTTKSPASTLAKASFAESEGARTKTRCPLGISRIRRPQARRIRRGMQSRMYSSRILRPTLKVRATGSMATMNRSRHRLARWLRCRKRARRCGIRMGNSSRAGSSTSCSKTAVRHG